MIVLYMKNDFLSSVIDMFVNFCGKYFHVCHLVFEQTLSNKTIHPSRSRCFHHPPWFKITDFKCSHFCRHFVHVRFYNENFLDANVTKKAMQTVEF